MNKTNNPYAQQILAKGRDLPTPQPSTRQVPARFADRFATYEEYQEAMADFLNGMWQSPYCPQPVDFPPDLCNHTYMAQTSFRNGDSYGMYDRYTTREDGDWDDIISPDDYEEILDRKRFNQSMGYNAWRGI